ncbi:MAG: hypothetical protein K6C94_09735 [Candidatus Gastranaerophilales bacterium]|nr:hypothetical protein [Candidatus Gastranaerophilales bacterium]
MRYCRCKVSDEKILVVIHQLSQKQNASLRGLSEVIPEKDCHAHFVRSQ